MGRSWQGMENDNKPKCFRVEQRTVVPGIKMKLQSSELETEKNDLYVVVEGRTERYFSRSGTVYLATAHMPPGEFFPLKNEANKFACLKHHQTGCTAPECGWSEKGGDTQ